MRLLTTQVVKSISKTDMTAVSPLTKSPSIKLLWCLRSSLRLFCMPESIFVWLSLQCTHTESPQSQTVLGAMNAKGTSHGYDDIAAGVGDRQRATFDLAHPDCEE
jgi:hypothetical protein